MAVEDTARAAFLEYRRGGGPEAMARVFDACARDLLLVAHHLAGHGVSPEDLVQATFLEVMRTADRYEEERRFLPWMLGVLANVARTHNRLERRRPEAERLEEGTAEDPHDQARLQELREAVAAEIAHLPDPQRSALTLSLIHGLTPTEIAHALGLPVGTVKSWVHRGVGRLKRLLPPSFALGLLALAGAPVSLAKVRERIVEAASSAGGPPIPPIRPSMRPLGWTTLGGSLLVAGAVWVASRPSGPEPASQPRPPGLATSAGPGSGLQGGGPLPSRAPAPRAAGEEQAEGLWIRARYGSDGAPASLEVVLEPRFGDELALRSRKVRTDGTGTAHLEGLAPGLYEVLPLQGGRQTVDVPGERSVTIEVPPGVAVEGRVLDPEGRPVAGAGLWLSMDGSAGEGAVLARTDGSGRYTMRDVPPGRLLQAVHDDWAPAAARAVLAEERALDFRLPGPASRVQGVVLDARGAPLPGAFVSFGREAGGPWSAALAEAHAFVPPRGGLTDAHGRFAIGGLPRDPALRVWARAPGHAVWRGEVDTRESLAPWLEIALQGGAVWEGRADRLSAGASSVFVHALPLGPADDLPPRWALPNMYVPAGAAFALPGLAPGPLLLRAEDDAGGRRAREAHAEDAGRLEWSPSMEDPGTLEGRVRCAGELPGGLRVRIERAGERPLLALVDREGRFEVPLLDRKEMDLWLHGPADGYGGPLAHLPAVQPWSRGVEIVLPRERAPSAWLVARVLDAGGAPHPRVSATAEDGTLVAGKPGEGGLVRIGPLPAGRFVLTAYSARGLDLHAGPFALQPGEERDAGEHRVRPAGGLEVRLADSPGSAAKVGRDLRATLTCPDGFVMPGFLVLAEGAGAWPALPPGPHRLTLLDGGIPFAQMEVEVPSGATARVEVDVPQTLRHALWIEGPQLLPGAPFEVTFRPQHGGPGLRLKSRVDPGARGAVRVEAELEPGTHTVEVRCGEARGEARIAAGERHGVVELR